METISVSEVILARLDKENKTKQWLATQINLSYSTLHQKLSNNTFTAEELISLCVLFRMDITSFISQEQKGVTDLMAMPISNRPDVSIETMSKYKRGGIGLESEHENGALLYLPYGVQEYLIAHYGILMDVLKRYEAAIEVAKAKYLEEDKHEASLSLEGKLHELRLVLNIFDHLIQSLKENN